MAQETETQDPVRRNAGVGAGIERGALSVPLPILGAIVLTVAICAIGYFAFRHQTQQIGREHEASLAAIAALKAGEIAAWLDERKGDAISLGEQSQIASELAVLRRGQSIPDARKPLLVRRLEIVRNAYRYDAIAVFDREGNRVLGTKNADRGGDHDAGAVAEAIRTGEVQFGDLHRVGDALLEMDVAAPLRIGGANATRVVGAIILHVDPAQFLFPLIRSWPTPSASAETLLVRRDGDHALFLNELRHRSDAAMTLRLPLDTPGLLAAMALKGQLGLLSGVDYRGKSVVGYALPVAGTSWTMLAKIDDDEIYADSRRLGTVVAVSSGLLLAACYATLAFWWRQRRADFAAARYRAELESQSLSRRFDYLSKYANDIVVLLDGDGRIVEANDRAVAVYGYSREELLGMDAVQFRAEERVAEFAANWQRVLDEGGRVYETQHRRKDGTTFPIEVSMRRIDVDNQIFVQGIGRDITERVNGEKALRESEARFRAMFETSNHGIGIVEIESMRFVDTNPAFCRMLGYARDELLALGVDDIHPPADLPRVRAEFARLAAGEAVVASDIPVLRKDRTVYPADISVARLDVGGRQCLAGTFIDLTERRRAEETLRASEDRFRRLHESLRDAFVQVDMAGRLLDWNQAYEDMLGYPSGELEHLTYSDLTPEKWHAMEARIVAEQIVPLGQSEVYEKEYVRKDGTVLPVELRTFLLRGADGRPEAMWAIVRDISERRRNEEELRKLARVVEQSPNAVLFTDREARIEYVNDAFVRNTGYSREEVLGKNPRFLHSDLTPRSTYVDLWDALTQGRSWRGEFINKRKDGSIFVEIAHIAPVRLPDGTVTHYAGVKEDITEKKRMTEELAAHRKYLEELVAQRTMELEETTQRCQMLASAGFEGIVITEAGRVVDANQQLVSMLGYPREELIGMAVENLLPLADRDRVLRNIRENADSHVEHSVLRKNGHLIEVEAHGQTKSIGGRSLRFTAIRDVTAFKKATADARQALAELHQHEHLLHHILDNLPGMVGYWDRNLRNIFANHAYVTFFGKSPQEIRGRHIVDLLGESLFELNRPYLEAALRGEMQVFERTIPVPGVPQEFRYTEAHYIPDRRDGQVVGILVIVFDVSDIKRAQIAAETASREAGRLAQARSDFLANMSHEIRTPLNAVLGLAQIAQRKSMEATQREYLQRILDSGQLLLSIVNDILDYSKIEAGKLVIESIPFELGEVIDRALDVTAPNAYAKGLDVRVDEADDLPVRLVGDPSRLTQVLVNLLSNAVKFTERGRVVLTVQRNGADIVFEVADTGIGMNANEVSRLFEPFGQADTSVTRRYGGTGLGLAICRRIVATMRGDIRVSSEPGSGTIFSVRLPLGEASASAPALSGISVQLMGLPAADAQRMAAALAARGVTAAIAMPGTTVDAAANLVVVACEGRPPLPSRLADGNRQCIALACGRGGACPNRDIHCTEYVNISRPWRARHIVAACAGLRPAEVVRASGRRRLEGVRILGIEDNAVNRLVLEEMLAYEGASLVCAEDGIQALDRLYLDGPRAYDLVISDIQMPLMDGYETTRHIHEIAPNLPVIGLTAHAMPGERDRCLAAGMADYLAKPVDIDALAACVSRHLPSRAAGNEQTTADAAEEAGVSAQAQSVVIVDWTLLEQRFNGNRAFVAKLVRTALDSHRRSPAVLRSAIEGGDWSGVASLAHSLKGMGGNLAAQALYDAAMQAEKSAREGKADASVAAERLVTVLEDFIAVLENRLH